jgi:hypothetical protein
LDCTSSDKADYKSHSRETQAMVDPVIMDYGDYEKVVSPETYSLGEEIRYIFAVPKNNTVGTNELDNAITLLEFRNDGELKRHIVKRNFMEMVTGPFEFRFLPVWSDREIAYSQSKGFLIINIPEKKVEIHTVIPGLDDNIENLAVLDEEKRIFVFEIISDAAGILNYDKTLRIIQFTNGSSSVLAEHSAGKKTSSYTEPWFIYEKKIFVYNDITTKLEVFDEQFKSVNHPIADVFNKNSKIFRSLRDFKIHPSLPFALITEIGKEPDISKFDTLPPEEKLKALEPIYAELSRTTLFLFQWTQQDEKKRMIPLLSSIGSIWKSYNPKDNYGDFEFSPDGKWFVFRDYSESSDNPVFVAVPISTNNPLYLGKPIKLGKVLRQNATGPRGTAWITNPTAFVMSDGLVLYRWNLDNIPSMERVKMPNR